MATRTDIEAKYNILRVGVISSSTISSRTTLIVNHLSQNSTDDKKAIASLHAKGSVANKLISAIEIAKRELVKDNRKVFQYSEISFDTISIAAAASYGAKGGSSAIAAVQNGDVAVDEEDEAFEVMGKAKKRDVPLLTVYLSLSSIKELRDAYGEQVERGMNAKSLFSRTTL